MLVEMQLSITVVLTTYKKAYTIYKIGVFNLSITNLKTNKKK